MQQAGAGLFGGLFSTPTVTYLSPPTHTHTLIHTLTYRSVVPTGLPTVAGYKYKVILMDG